MAKKSRTKSAPRGGQRPVKKTAAAGRPASPARTKTVSESAGGAAAAKDKDAAPVLSVGMAAPDFTLTRDDGTAVSLADFAGSKLVIYFYPRADTPGCTREAIDFGRLKGEFAKAKTKVIGVSADPVKAQAAFRDKHKLAIPLGSDESKAVIAAYGAWGQKSLYGRTFQGILRTTVLVDSEGRIARIWRNVKVDGHADAVLAAARSI